MAKHHRKSSKQHRKSKRRTHRRRQRGGAGCAAMPPTNASFGQRGGMAPFNSPGMLLDHPTVVQSESAQQLADIQAATTMAKAYTGSLQAGGRRRSRKHRSHKRKSHRRQRKQYGGAAQSAAYGPFDGLLKPSLIGGSPQALGQNPQFVTEAGVNSLYGYEAGAQH